MRKSGLGAKNPARGWLIPLLIAAVGMSGCEKARLDDEVRRLCAIDGGMKVYEEVVLPSEKFDKYGLALIPSKDKATPNDDYFYERLVTFYIKGNPELWQTHFRIIRRSDGKVLGELVSYTRRGGDLPGPWQASSFICPNPETRLSLEQSVFKKRPK